MAFLTLFNLSPRNQLNLGIRRFGKRPHAIWDNLRSLRSSCPRTQIPFAGQSSVFSMHFSTWNKSACTFTRRRLQKQPFRQCKLCFHISSRHLLHLQEEAQGEKDVKIIQKETHQSIINRESSSTDQSAVHYSTDSNLSLATEGTKDLTNDLEHQGVAWTESTGLENDPVEKDAPRDSKNRDNPLTMGMVNNFLNGFFGDKKVKKAARENGLTGDLYSKAFYHFREKIFVQMKKKNKEMINTFNSVYFNSDYMENLFPLFMAFARKSFPMLSCMDEVKKISDLRGPADLYPEARTMKRKIIYHAGPTNSGKTHAAIESFKAAESGVYCSPLRLLATEVFQRANDAGVPCDLLTGEDRQWAISPDKPANHVACTVEMSSTRRQYECAVLDEIQMMRDTDRGWAWTNALLGLPCKEIHVCGESSAIDVVQRLVHSCGDEMEVLHYERLSPLEIGHKTLGSLANVKSGDCIIAFSQRGLYELRRDIERKSKKKCAIIYGGLPPATKIEQAAKFNDPSDECSVLVASDAIGMGLNLNIKRIVFSTMMKYNGTGMVQLSSSQAKQIAGRAGRFGTEYPVGEAITLQYKDTEILQTLMSEPIEDVQTAGLAPSVEQIEMLSQELPDASLLKLYEVFESVVQLDGANYFMCDLDERKKIAEKLGGIPLTIREQYLFSTAPVNTSKVLVMDLAVKFADYVSRQVLVTTARLERLVRWPPKVPRSLEQLQQLEAVHEALDLYLWLSYRFPEVFVHQENICEMQQEVEDIIGTVVSSNALGPITTRKPRHRFNDKRLIKWMKRDRLWYVTCICASFVSGCFRVSVTFVQAYEED